MKTILQYLTPQLSQIFEKTDLTMIFEIRLRAGNILTVKTKNGIYYVNKNGEFSIYPQRAMFVTPYMVNHTLQIMSRYSLYAYENELRQGYITLPGGHRVGITGTAVLCDGHIESMRCISGLNIRIARQCQGCAESLLPWIRSENSIYNTLIVSPPGHGKTTMLRDLIRILSSKERFMVSVVDERAELSGTREGIARFDLGYCTDVLASCPKIEGMLLMLRSMGPEIMAVDEIGGSGEYEMLNMAINSGVKLLCTIHGESLLQLQQKPEIRDLIIRGMFPRIVVLSAREGPGTIEHIYEGDTQNVLL